MKKLSLIALFAFATSFLATAAHADIFEPARMKYSAGAPNLDMPTILDDLTQIMQYLGTREGVFYDFNRHEVCNYAAATLYTLPHTGFAVDFGALNADGIVATLDWNAGAVIPSQDVPLMNFLQYFYVGGGVGARSEDGDWQVAYGFDAQFKFTF